MHGYVPYNQLKLQSRRKLRESKNKASGYIAKAQTNGMDFKISDFDTANCLLLLSFVENEVNEKHIEALLTISFELSEYIQEG